MSELTTHEVLVKTRNRLSDENRWARYGASGRVGGGGSQCVLGTLSLFVERRLSLSIFDEAADALHSAIGLNAGERVFDWNDDVGTSHADLLAALDKAIAATAPEPDTSFLSTVRVEPERVA